MKKQCTKCHIEKPIEAFSRDRSMKDGHSFRCKDCVKETVTSKLHQLVDVKICSGCHIEKTSDDFHRNRYSPDGLQNYCKPCAKANRDHEKELVRVNAYYHSIAGTGVIPEEKLCRTCNQILPEKNFTRSKYSKTGLVSQCKKCFKAKHGNRAIERQRGYRATIPGFNRDRKNRRKALKRNAPRIERIYRAKVYEHDEGKCYMCGRKLPFDGFDLEHVIPLCKGGSHTYDNVKVACRACNARKNVKLLDEL